MTLDRLLSAVPDSPLIAFTILLLVSLTIPPLFERLRLPGLVGLLVAGVILGPGGLRLLDPQAETIALLSDIGKIYLMFVAGLEIDLSEFRKKKWRSFGFGLTTFLVPMLVGIAVGRGFGFGWTASVLIGSLIASHTLLAYPIVTRLGVTRNEAITVTIGATIFTDIAALLVLAICVTVHAGEFSAVSLSGQLSGLALYVIAVLFGIDWAGKEFFRRTGDEQGNQFLFVLLAVFLSAVGAQLLDVDKIVGAFLAGLAVNDVVDRSPVEEKIEFVGSTLFIPFFFVGMGLLLDVDVFIETLDSALWLTLAIVGGVFGAKLVAAAIAKLLYRYSWVETLTMWSLSLPQVAATLAAALAGLQAGLIDSQVFNAILVLMLVTSLVGPLLTERFARQLPLVDPEDEIDTDDSIPWWERVERELNRSDEQLATPTFSVVVPVSNPLTERYLIEMASLLARHESGRVVALTIAQAHVHMDEPQLNDTLIRGDRLLARAEDLGQEFGVEVTSVLRIDDDIAEGISRAAREQQASLVVMGWSDTAVGLRARLFGNLIDNVFWASHCPVAVTRLLDEPVRLQRILVPIKNFTVQARLVVRFAQLFADTHQSSVTFLHVADRRMLPAQMAGFERDLKGLLAAGGPQVAAEIVTLAHDNIAEAIIAAARSFDLVILRSLRRRTAGGLAVSDVTARLLEELTCSLVLFGESHS
ncbi:Kef-type K+ transport system, membrane component [Rubidibacter lacunae KORDI 51-2]|uniref:Kef-type K+ transport system, membrane component n=1 Tax=Rubidibacter lacunae KORDI 51-2 TaxID=582515 RepID=U5DPK3_9CHRO|nr:cation:proton antiporter [Rubidibacter lacunae]ERN42797.1 Kef-type K+ transport system, membrane component [Rubidibacter lacunae KORDI 51-2]